MPRGFSTDFNNALQNRVQNLAVLVKVTRLDATVLGFTGADHDLLVDSQLYESADGLSMASFHSSIGSGVDNSEITGFLSDDRITVADLEKGLYNHATIEVYLVHRDDLTLFKKVSKGFVGEVWDDLDQFRAEVRGLLQVAKQQIGWLTSPTCRWVFGSIECGFVPTLDSNTVASRTSDRVFRATGLGAYADGFFAFGLLTFTSGACDGVSMEIKKWTQSTKEIELVMEMPAAVAVSDAFSITQGCSKLWAQCKTYANAERFGGEPHMPGLDKLLIMPK